MKNSSPVMGAALIIAGMLCVFLLIGGYIRLLDYMYPFPCAKTWEKIEILKQKADNEKKPLEKLKLETAVQEELRIFCGNCDCES